MYKMCMQQKQAHGYRIYTKIHKLCKKLTTGLGYATSQILNGPPRTVTRVSPDKGPLSGSIESIKILGVGLF
jgi:hypothetical protein